MAASLARVHGENKVRRQVGAELVDVARVDVVLVAECDVDDVVGQGEEVLRDLAGTGVGAVQDGGEDGALASRVELEVDAALRENGRFELVQGRVEGERESVDLFRRGGEEAVLEHEADFELAFDDSEEFGCAWVDVGRIHAAGLDESNCTRDVLADEEGEVGFVGDEDAAALAPDGSGLEVEGEGVVHGPRVGEGRLAVVVDGEELLKAVNLGEVGGNVLGESRNGGGIGGRRNEAGEAGGLAAAAVTTVSGVGWSVSRRA